MFSSQQHPCWQEPAYPQDRAARWRAVTIRSTCELDNALAPVLGEMVLAGYPEKDRFAVRLALEEGLINAVKHGNHDDPAKRVSLRFRVTPESIVAEIEDEGMGFDPSQVPDPLAPENLERSSGRGLLLMRAYMTWVHYNDHGNCVTLCKYRSLT
jgi:serine/threonine-protein kinase RsbW